MTNGEKFKDVFQISQTDDCSLNYYGWLPIHDAIEISMDWWNAEYKEPTTKNDLALIRTEGLDEEIRCTMCTNTMKSDRGCDGSCVVNNAMYKRVMDAIEKRIQTTTKNDLGVDCIDRVQAQTEIEMNAFRYTFAKERCGIGEVEWNSHLISIDDAVDIIRNLLSVSQEPILDKIRVEIEQGYCKVNNDYDHGRNYGLYIATQIIDKYKAESEG